MKKDQEKIKFSIFHFLTIFLMGELIFKTFINIQLVYLRRKIHQIIEIIRNIVNTNIRIIFLIFKDDTV